MSKKNRNVDESSGDVSHDNEMPSGVHSVPGTPTTPAPDNPTSTAKPEKPVESKADKFRRLYRMRLPAALKRIGHLANLANRAQYERDDAQTQIVIRQLQEACAACLNAYKDVGKATTTIELP